MAINWDAPVRTQHRPPLVGEIQSDKTTGGLIRVALPSLSQSKPETAPTVWHYAEDGTMPRGSDEWRLSNFDPNDGVSVCRLQKER